VIGLIRLLLAILASTFKSRWRLEAENAALRQHLTVLRRKVKGAAWLTNTERWFFIFLYRRFPSILDAITVIRPDTLVRWLRAGFRLNGRWKSRRFGGRRQIQPELRALIRRVRAENPL